MDASENHALGHRFVPRNRVMLIMPLLVVSVPQGAHGFPKAKEDEIYEHDIWPFLKKHGILR